VIVEIDPPGEKRTSLPITLTIKKTSKKPSVEVLELGNISVKKYGNNYQAQFWAQTPGQYNLIVKESKNTFEKIINIKEQTYITFKNEFGFFLILFLITSLGMIKWIKKILKTKN